MTELGHSDSCGRLRFVVLSLDSAQVRETLFEEKMQPRRHSMEMVVGILRSVLRTQQKAPAPATAPQEPAAESQGTPPPPKIRLRKSRVQEGALEKEIDEVNFSGAAGCVFAGLQDGAAQACAAAGKDLYF